MPTNKDDLLFDSLSIDSDEGTENESLMASHYSLPKSTRISINNNNNSAITNYYTPSIKSNDKQTQIKRITKELIDDEIPLIKI